MTWMASFCTDLPRQVEVEAGQSIPQSNLNLFGLMCLLQAALKWCQREWKLNPFRSAAQVQVGYRIWFNLLPLNFTLAGLGYYRGEFGPTRGQPLHGKKSAEQRLQAGKRAVSSLAAL